MSEIVQMSSTSSSSVVPVPYREADKGDRPGCIPHSEVTDEEWAALEQFRAKYKEDIDFSSPYLTYDVVLRFLRARNLDLVRAAEMLKKHLAWVDKVKPNEIKSEDVKTAVESGSMRMTNPTLSGKPCIFVDLAKWRPQDYGVDMYVAMNSYFQVHAPLGADSGVHQIVVLFDMKGWAMWHAKYLSYILELVGLAQDQYPERLANVFMVGAPLVFKGVWNLIKPFVDAKTVKKVEFVSDHKRMLEIFRAEDLPPSLGGTKEEPYPVPNLKGQENVPEV